MGTTSIFAAVGLGLAIAGFAAALFVGGVQGTDVDPSTAAGGVLGASIALIPFIATPILAVVAGLWAGTVTRQAGRAAAAAFVGTLVGIIVMVLLIAIGLALGTAIGAVPDVNAVTESLGVNLAGITELQFFASVTGLTYLLVQLIIASTAAAVVGGLMPDAYHATPEERAAPRTTRV